MVTCTVLFKTLKNTLQLILWEVINCSGLALKSDMCLVGEGNKQPKEKETALFTELK